MTHCRWKSTLIRATTPLCPWRIAGTLAFKGTSVRSGRGAASPSSRQLQLRGVVRPISPDRRNTGLPKTLPGSCRTGASGVGSIYRSETDVVQFFSAKM